MSNSDLSFPLDGLQPDPSWPEAEWPEDLMILFAKKLCGWVSTGRLVSAALVDIHAAKDGDGHIRARVTVRPAIGSRERPVTRSLLLKAVEL